MAARAQTRRDGAGLPVADINAAISRLSPDDLAKVEAHIAFHKASAKRSRKEGNASTVLNTDELWLLGLIADFMKGSGADYTPIEMLRTSQDFPAFSVKVPPLMEYLGKAKLEKTQRRLVVWLALEILYEEKTRLNTACSARVIMRELHRIPALIDSQFPGYARMGMLGMVARAHVHREDED